MSPVLTLRSGIRPLWIDSAGVKVRGAVVQRSLVSAPGLSGTGIFGISTARWRMRSKIAVTVSQTVSGGWDERAEAVSHLPGSLFICPTKLTDYWPLSFLFFFLLFQARCFKLSSLGRKKTCYFQVWEVVNFSSQSEGNQDSKWCQFFFLLYFESSDAQSRQSCRLLSPPHHSSSLINGPGAHLWGQCKAGCKSRCKKIENNKKKMTSHP